MDGLLIEPEQPSDHARIAEVVRRAFSSQPGVDVMVAAIRVSPRYRQGLAFVARADDRVVGFVMISGTDLVGADGSRREVLTLTPLAVAPEYERRGIGSALVRAALDEADRRAEQLVVLEGSPQYYDRFGFEAASEYGIDLPLPDWAPPQAAQVYRLTNYRPDLRGRIEYPPAIAAISQ